MKTIKAHIRQVRYCTRQVWRDALLLYESHLVALLLLPLCSPPLVQSCQSRPHLLPITMAPSSSLRESLRLLVGAIAFITIFLVPVHVQGQSFDPNKAGPESWDPAKVGTNKTTNTTYNNPIFTQNVGDPWMTKYTSGGEDWYLFTYTTNDNITLRRSRALTDNWDEAESRVVFNPNSTSGEPWSTDLWAPEIHNISGTWYIIFTATPDFDNPPPMQDALCPINCPGK